MTDIANLFPVTVTAAISLFVVKEGVEAFRRRRAEQRRLRAVKSLCARECELNLWTVKNYRNITSYIRSEVGEAPRNRIALLSSKSGRQTMQFGIDAYAQMSIFEPHATSLRCLMLEVATASGDMFSKLEAAVVAIADLEHIRESLIHHTSEDPEHLDVFTMYAEEKLDEIERSLNALYVECTGKPLENARLR